jgi:hypothetical protein
MYPVLVLSAEHYSTGDAQEIADTDTVLAVMPLVCIINALH